MGKLEELVEEWEADAARLHAQHGSASPYSHDTSDYEARQLERCANELRDALPRWIPVAERPPGEGALVLVTVAVHDELVVWEAMWKGEQWISFGCGPVAPIAWQEMPKPYRAEGGE